MASVKDMARFGLALESARLISVEDFDALCNQGCKPLPGDVLISKDGAKYLDKVVPVYTEADVVLLSSIAVLRPNGLMATSFLTCLLKDGATKSRLKSYVSGAAIPRVVLKDFKAFRIVLPPAELLDRFDRFANPVLRLAIALERRGTALRAARDLVLPRLISGEIDVGDLDINVPELAA